MTKQYKTPWFYLKRQESFIMFSRHVKQNYFSTVHFTSFLKLVGDNDKMFLQNSHQQQNFGIKCSKTLRIVKHLQNIHINKVQCQKNVSFGP